MSADPCDQPSPRSLDVDGSVESYLQRRIAPDVALEAGQTGQVVGLFDGKEPEPAGSGERQTRLPAPHVCGGGRTGQKPAILQAR